MKLYPLKFEPQYLEKIWGGNRIKNYFKRTEIDFEKCGESWEISGVEGRESVVSNGFLKGNNLNELTEIYMDELLGHKVFLHYGNEFPLLLKLIDADDFLSIQVHPDDKLAQKRHQSYGKTEMWYVLDADKDSYLINGFNKNVSKEEYLSLLNENKLTDILENVPIKAGDSAFIPAGRVHAIGKGILLAEIQQTSDITYRIFDWNRVDDEGNSRELHTDAALEAIDFSKVKDPLIKYTATPNQSSNIATCPYFSCNILLFDKYVEKVFVGIDSFVLYMVIEGAFTVNYEGGSEIVKSGETILIPACIEEISFDPLMPSRVLEIYIP